MINKKITLFIIQVLLTLSSKLQNKIQDFAIWEVRQFLQLYVSQRN